MLRARASSEEATILGTPMYQNPPSTMRRPRPSQNSVSLRISLMNSIIRSSAFDRCLHGGGGFVGGNCFAGEALHDIDHGFLRHVGDMAACFGLQRGETAFRLLHQGLAFGIGLRLRLFD